MRIACGIAARLARRGVAHDCRPIRAGRVGVNRVDPPGLCDRGSRSRHSRFEPRLVVDRDGEEFDASTDRVPVTALVVVDGPVVDCGRIVVIAERAVEPRALYPLARCVARRVVEDTEESFVRIVFGRVQRRWIHVDGDELEARAPRDRGEAVVRSGRVGRQIRQLRHRRKWDDRHTVLLTVHIRSRAVDRSVGRHRVVVCRSRCLAGVPACVAHGDAFNELAVRVADAAWEIVDEHREPGEVVLHELEASHVARVAQ